MTRATRTPHRTASRSGQRPLARTGAAAHRDWLRLVTTEGPWLAAPALASVYPQGIPPLDRERRLTLTEAAAPLERAWDAWDRGGAAALDAYREQRDRWVRTVLEDVVGWRGELAPAPLAAVAVAPDGRTSHRATWSLGGAEESPALLVWLVDPVESLHGPADDGWATSPVERLEIMCREAGVPLGLVTDGHWWGLVSVPGEGGLPAFGVVDAQAWSAEPDVRDAMVELLSPLRVVGGDPDDRLPALFARSVLAAEEVTESLGGQVRQAVELVVAALSDAGRAARAAGVVDPLPSPGEVYEASVTVLMRVVFLLFAEERGLLPASQTYRAAYGLTGQLDALDARARESGEETLDATSETWHRLLATSTALYDGATFEDLRLPAYGGSLMDPQRFACLDRRDEAGRLVLTVSDRVMRAALDAVQVARVKGEARRVSFREVDVEQIGYIYEGLLGYTCAPVTELTLGVVGPAGREAEVPVRVLDDLVEEHGDDASTAAAIIAWAKEHQPSAKLPTAKQLAKAMAAGDTLEDAERALRLVAPDDETTRQAVRPWIGAVRRDLRGRLVVLQPGDLAVVETAGRRHAGAHYTPSALAEEVVRHALEPLCHEARAEDLAAGRPGHVRPPEEILDLHVADIACGSGAFLVAAVRYLAARVVEARQEHESRVEGDRDAALLQARREVVARCIYGVDIDPMAVEMCKLSLWLVSLDPAKPFSFVDDKVLVGNSLLGLTTVRQVEELHPDPAAGVDEQASWAVGADGQFEDVLEVGVHLERAARMRERLRAEIDPGHPSLDARAKHSQNERSRSEVAPLRRAADGVIATGLLHGGGKPGRALDDAMGLLRGLVLADVEGDPTGLDRRLEVGLMVGADTGRHRWQPLHWVLELPDVMARGGFDAVVGNPPFLGGKKVSGAVGSDVREWLVHQVAFGKTGNADLVAYFFLRALDLLRPGGRLGLIATNTLAQGDTREVGLDQMVERGLSITRAIQSRSWPARSANLEYAAVWATKGAVPAGTRRVADDVVVGSISTLLEPEGRVTGHPVRLAENAGVSFIGCYVLSMGFVLDPDEAQGWIAADPRTAEVVKPYLTGEDLNSRPDASPSRWVIDFYDRSEEAAAAYPVPYDRLVRTVRDERQRSNRKVLRERWWQYADKRPAMRKALADLDECLVIALVSKSVMPYRVTTGTVFSHALGVFATDSYADQAVLSSSMHTLWAITRGSTLETRVRYTPSDVFDTFPRPELTDRIADAGRVLDTERRAMMTRLDLGLTALYNRVHDPAIAPGVDADVDRLREIHVEVDEATMAAYGWADLPLDHGHHTYRQMTRWTISPAARVEVLDRLLAENHRRAAVKAGEEPS